MNGNSTYTESNYTLDKTEIKRVMRRSLMPAGRTTSYEKVYWPKWLEDRLTTLAIYGYSDKTKCPANEINCLRLMSQGQNYQTIAIQLKLKPQTVRVYIYNALDWIVDHTPANLLANIPVSHTSVRMDGCPHCAENNLSGTLLWNDSDGVYWCLSCSRQFDSANRAIRREATCQKGNY
jgi:hypothetical protein